MNSSFKFWSKFKHLRWEWDRLDTGPMYMKIIFLFILLGGFKENKKKSMFAFSEMKIKLCYRDHITSKVFWPSWNDLEVDVEWSIGKIRLNLLIKDRNSARNWIIRKSQKFHFSSRKKKWHYFDEIQNWDIMMTLVLNRYVNKCWLTIATHRF